jgi:hypothetical protein
MNSEVSESNKMLEGSDSKGSISQSPQNSSSRTRRKKKKGARALTIEEIFNTLSTKKAYGGDDAQSRYVLTPRSAEACLRQGVDPEDLKIRDLDSFWEPGLDPARQGMRHEMYCETRHEKIKALRKERADLTASSPKHKRGGEVGNQSEMNNRTNAMIEAENRRLAKVQARQKKEIEQLMAFELSMTKIQEDNAQKLEKARRNEEKFKKQRLKRQKELQEHRRLKQLKKAAESVCDSTTQNGHVSCLSIYILLLI